MNKMSDTGILLDANDEPRVIAVVEGLPYSVEKWHQVFEEMTNIGNAMNRFAEGQSGFLFWETASNIEKLMEQVGHVNKTGHYCEFPDECVLPSSM